MAFGFLIVIPEVEWLENRLSQFLVHHSQFSWRPTQSYDWSKKIKISCHFFFFFLVLLVFMLLFGSFFLVSSVDLVGIYLFFELQTIILFILVAKTNSAYGTEAGLKYLVLGGILLGYFYSVVLYYTWYLVIGAFK